LLLARARKIGHRRLQDAVYKLAPQLVEESATQSDTTAGTEDLASAKSPTESVH
jgi:hypothetical protein